MAFVSLPASSPALGGPPPLYVFLPPSSPSLGGPPPLYVPLPGSVGAFGPSTVAGNVLFMEATTGVAVAGPNATSWTDQSVNAFVYNAVGTVPLDPTGINGHPSLTCGASSQGFTHASARPVAPGAARSIFVVCKASSTVGGCLFSISPTTPSVDYWLAGAGFSVPGLCDANDATTCDTIATPTISGVAVVAQWMVPAQPNANTVFKLSGVAKTVTKNIQVVAEGALLGSGIGLWSEIPSILGFVGNISAVYIWDHVLSGPDETIVMAGINAKWGT